MLRSDLSDVHSLQDSDVEALIKQLKVVVKKHGVFLTMRIVAFVLGAFRRENFIKAHEVKETSSPNILRVPSVLAGKEPTEQNAPVRLDHASLWKKESRLHFLMSEPYYNEQS